MALWGPLAAAAAKKLVATPAGRKFAQQGLEFVVAAASKSGTGKTKKALTPGKQRTLAYKLARQVRGELSVAVFNGSTEEHWVVWKDGVPIAAFPPVEGDLARRKELAHVTDADRFDPPPPPPPKPQTG